MNIYEWWQWLLFFYFYCFVGWIWESSYVSVKEKRPVNRGFLHLPLLPLYGSGAVVVLFACLPFKNHPLVVYGVGMIAATSLELMTGLTMEAIYKVKYWDYSSKKINYRGVICLEASLLWGVFSLVMVKVVHAPVEHLLLQLPVQGIWCMEVVLSFCFCHDFYVSNRDALRLARILTNMEKAKENLQKDLRLIEEELQEQKRILEEHLEEAKQKARSEMEDRILEAMERTEKLHQRTVQARQHLSGSASLFLNEAKDRAEEAVIEMMVQADEIREKEEAWIEAVESATRDRKKKREHAREEVCLNVLFHNQEVLQGIKKRKSAYMELQNQHLAQAERLSRSMMLRNPTARTITGRDVNLTLRYRAHQWMEEKKQHKELDKKKQ